MPFPLIVSHASRAKRIGWYATRQHLLNHGHTLQEVTSVLIVLLQSQGANHA